MNVPRLALAAVVTWIVFLVIGFVVNGVLLQGIYAQHAHVMRPAADMMLPVGLGVSLLGFFVFVYVYAKGYEGGSGLVEGMRFGVLVGMLLVCFANVWEYVVFPISTQLFVYWILDYIIEFAIYGMIVGYLYKVGPRPAPLSA